MLDFRAVLGMLLIAAIAVLIVCRPVPRNIVNDTTHDPARPEDIEEIAGTSMPPAAAGNSSHRNFLTYSQNWLFHPPIGNVLPSRVTPRGAMSVYVENPMSFAGASDCGCD
jgi:hypothetical protein